jgi:hypothetical protein
MLGAHAVDADAWLQRIAVFTRTSSRRRACNRAFGMCGSLHSGFLKR